MAAFGVGWQFDTLRVRRQSSVYRYSDARFVGVVGYEEPCTQLNDFVVMVLAAMSR